MKLTVRTNRTICREDYISASSLQYSVLNSEDDRREDLRNRNDGCQHKHDAKRRNFSGSTYLRIFVLRTRALNFILKTTFVFLSLFIFLLVFIHLWDQLFCQIGEWGEHPSSSSSSSFAVVINTFRRPERLKKSVQHYAETCGRRYNIGQIFVVWADPETEPPPAGEFFFDISASSFSLQGSSNKTNVRDHIPVEILVKDKNSLNARFEPIPQLQTTSIFMVDDDILVACPSLLMAFQAWQQNPDSMVGYYPRLATAPKTLWATPSTQAHNEQLVYHAWPMIYWRQKFNIILTKACFLHSKYLELYTNDASFPKEIKDHIDRHRNCEDIAMSMLVANYTKHSSKNPIEALPARPFYVEGKVSDVGLFGGISSGSNHFATRSVCLTHLTDIFMSKGWGQPLVDEFELVGNSWLKHSPGFWWQSGPSNIFEWFGLTNFFS